LDELFPKKILLAITPSQKYQLNTDADAYTPLSFLALLTCLWHMDAAVSIMILTKQYVEVSLHMSKEDRGILNAV